MTSGGLQYSFTLGSAITNVISLYNYIDYLGPKLT